MFTKTVRVLRSGLGESTLTVDWEKNPLPHSGIESASACVDPMFYQLNYISAPVKNKQTNNTLPSFSVLVVANVRLCVGPQNKTGQPARRYNRLMHIPVWKRPRNVNRLQNELI